MKKIFVLLVFSLFPLFLFGGEVMGISIKPEIGFLDGKVNEYVFGAYKGAYYNVSRLNWDVDLIPYAGIEIETTLMEKFSFSAGARKGLPKRSGKMEDFDWMNTSDLSRNTHYSKHENYLLGYEKYWASVGWYFHPKNEIVLFPFLTLSGEVYGFDGKNGYTQYAADNGVEFWSPDLPKDYCSKTLYPTGSVISYSQQRYLADLGLKTIVSIKKNLDFSLTGEIGFYNLIMGHDYHWNVNKYKEYVDLINGFMLSDMKLETELSYLLNKHNQISLKTGLQQVFKVQGDTTARKIEEKEWEDSFPNGGGAGSTIVNVSLMYSLMF